MISNSCCLFLIILLILINIFNRLWIKIFCLLLCKMVLSYSIKFLFCLLELIWILNKFCFKIKMATKTTSSRINIGGIKKGCACFGCLTREKLFGFITSIITWGLNSLNISSLISVFLLFVRQLLFLLTF